MDERWKRAILGWFLSIFGGVGGTYVVLTIMDILNIGGM